jgi:heme/copper-type cytochrome/quinol oxidase subunit 3
MDTTIATANVPHSREIPQGRLAMWLLIVGEFIIFGGLIAVYLMYRLRHPEWAEMAAYTNTTLGAVNTVVLLTSSFFAVKAHEFAVKKDTKKIKLYIYLTILCALLFLGIKAVEYYTEIHHGFTLSGAELVDKGNLIGSSYWGFYFLMTGIHGLHVIAGAIIFLTVLYQVNRNRNLQRVEMAGMYWHMVDIIWIFLFPLLYIAH